MISFQEFAKAVNFHAVTHGFWNNLNSVSREYILQEKLLRMVEEICELATSYREGTQDNLCDKNIGISNKEEEIADIIIRIFDFAFIENVNLDKIISIKHNYNLTRPYLHGKKF